MITFVLTIALKNLGMMVNLIAACFGTFEVYFFPALCWLTLNSSAWETAAANSTVMLGALLIGNFGEGGGVSWFAHSRMPTVPRQAEAATQPEAVADSVVPVAPPRLPSLARDRRIGIMTVQFRKETAKHFVLAGLVAGFGLFVTFTALFGIFGGGD